VRNSLNDGSYKDRKAVTANLKEVYSAPTVEVAEQSLLNFAQRWDNQYPTISQSWLNHWSRITPFVVFSETICKVV
jgi:putative transposase